MRTTVTIDDDLLDEVKLLAVQTHQSVSSVMEEALRRLIAVSQDARSSTETVLPVFFGNGLQPGVDLDDGVALRDLMDGL